MVVTEENRFGNKRKKMAARCRVSPALVKGIFGICKHKSAEHKILSLHKHTLYVYGHGRPGPNHTWRWKWTQIPNFMYHPLRPYPNKFSLNSSILQSTMQLEPTFGFPNIQIQDEGVWKKSMIENKATLALSNTGLEKNWTSENWPLKCTGHAYITYPWVDSFFLHCPRKAKLGTIFYRCFSNLAAPNAARGIYDAVDTLFCRVQCNSNRN